MDLKGTKQYLINPDGRSIIEYEIMHRFKENKTIFDYIDVSFIRRYAIVFI